jgi:molybdopterin converting factor small subunit
MPTVRVEFYGLARHRAGVAGLAVEAATLGDALRAVQQDRPGLRVLNDNAVSPEYLVSIAGRRFVTDTATALTDEPLLILGADAGG